MIYLVEKSDCQQFNETKEVTRGNLNRNRLMGQASERKIDPTGNLLSGKKLIGMNIDSVVIEHSQAELGQVRLN